jgi:hypothetical protein
LSPKQKQSKSKEELKEFTVGSVQPKTRAPKEKSAKVPVQNRVEISEKDFPVLAGLLKSKDLQVFRAEMKKVLVPLQELVEKGMEEEKSEAQKVQKAYAMAIALFENSKVVR